MKYGIYNSRNYKGLLANWVRERRKTISTIVEIIKAY